MSSFTATREMMEIMQEHGEVVVCTGSNLNIENVDLFLQADCRWDWKVSLYLGLPQHCSDLNPRTVLFLKS